MIGDLLRGTLRVIPLPTSNLGEPAGLILPKNPPFSTARAAFIDCLREYVQEISERGLVRRIGSGRSDGDNTASGAEDDRQ